MSTKHSKKHPTHPSSQEAPAKEPQKEDDIIALTGHIQRLQADFENYKKRVEKEKSNDVLKEQHILLQKFLPLMDAFDKALEPPDEGISLLHKQLQLIFQEQKVTHIQALGKPFDPHLHEVIMQQPSKKAPNTVLEEVQKGYKHHDLVLRHSKVIVSKKQD